MKDLKHINTSIDFQAQKAKLICYKNQKREAVPNFDTASLFFHSFSFL